MRCPDLARKWDRQTAPQRLARRRAWAWRAQRFPEPLILRSVRRWALSSPPPRLPLQSARSSARLSVRRLMVWARRLTAEESAPPLVAPLVAPQRARAGIDAADLGR